MNLKVTYKSQWDSDADDSKNDCGAASLAMCINYFGGNVTTDTVFQKTGEKVDDGINFTQLQQAATAFNFKLVGSINKNIDDIKNLIDRGIPAIVVVHYEFLPNKQDTYKGGHILVVRGYDADKVYTNDPDFYSTRRNEGDNKAYPIAEFVKAWNSTLDGNSPGNLWYVEPPKDWSFDTCAEKLEKLQADRDYQEQEKDKYKTEARDSRTKIKTLNEQVSGYSTKYAQLTELYKNVLNGTNNNEEYQQLLTLHNETAQKLEDANKTIIEKNEIITGLETNNENLYQEVKRLKDQKFTTRETLWLFIRSLSRDKDAIK